MDQSGMQEPKQEREQQPTGEAVTCPESEQETEMVALDSPQTEHPPSFYAPQHQVGYPPVQHFHQHQQQRQHQQQQLQVFWSNQMQEVEQATDFKNHTLPLARIKKIMKADEDVRMISAEAPVVFAKACEMFILELTLRSWIHTEENKRRTLLKNDIAAAISEETLGIPRPEPLPYYFVPGHPSQVSHPAMTYAAANQPPPPMAFNSLYIYLLG
ncbi:hypothetical protein MKW94_003676 [Papaver nudicaule]|uniref:Core Histone H2A/H2B/H3 domain-containing protein n=1 Tax=Papaver nudicaule TaxID=74823 RepID=A0AA42B3E7_PAPNU|nr:hypothetical protein [Papaver nudicaule]